MSINTHIAASIDAYITAPYDLGYALLITGHWGSGKTFTVQQHLRSTYPGRYLYVSLNGTSSKADIDSAITAQIVGGAGAAAIRLGTTVIGGLMSKIGIQEKPDETIDSVVTRLSRLMSDKFLVFDDLERANIPIVEVLGYINEYVERHKFRVIILANEMEINDRPEYERRKEKLIGQTLNIVADFDVPFDAFVAELKSDAARALLQDNRERIRAVFDQSDLQNLRVLRQTVHDIERLVAATDPVLLKTHPALLHEASQAYAALSFEYRSGRLPAAELLVRRREYFRDIASGDATDSVWARIRARYPDGVATSQVLSDKLLHDMLARGLFDRASVAESFSQSGFFGPTQKDPPWLRLWKSPRHGNPVDFQAALVELEEGFRTHSFVHVPEVLHVFGVRLWLARIEVLKLSTAEIFAECLEYINFLYEAGHLAGVSGLEEDASGPFPSALGYSFRERSTPEFRALYQHLDEKIGAALRDTYPKVVNDLLELAAVDPDLFFRRLAPSRSDDGKYVSLPVLTAISPDTFVTRTLEQSWAVQAKIFMTLHDRYQHLGPASPLLAEAKWFEAVVADISVRAEAAAAIDRARLRELAASYLIPVLKGVRDRLADLNLLEGPPR